MSHDKQDMAEDRTDWAEDRTILANERTFAGWLRTGMGSIAVAVGLKAVFGDFEPTWLAKVVATIFLFAALLIFWGARRQAANTRDRLTDRSVSPVSIRHMTVLAVTFAVGAVATGVVLWAL